MRRTVALFACLLLTASLASAELLEVPLDRRIDASLVIVEGTVVESAPFMNPAGTMIYTSHRIHVYKALKLGPGSAEDLRTVELITPGGRLGDQLHVIRPVLSLEPLDTGLFFLELRADYAGLAAAYLPYASLQGFVEYRSQGRSAFDPFNEYESIKRDLYEPIRRRTGGSYVVLDDFDANAPHVRPGASGSGGAGTDSHSITSTSPAVVRAGIQEVLTINGSGFGTFTGAATIFFDDSDDGAGGSFGSIDPEHVVSWSDSQIQVRVPNRTGGVDAGTGRIIVRNSAGEDAQSPSDVTIEYALNEILNSGTLYRMNLVNENVRGGYTYRYGTNTAGNGVDFTTLPDATARFEDALQAWNCSGDWNADVDGTTTVNATGNDDVNIAAFDNDADPLPAGVLGRASNFFGSCGGDTWRLTGVDIRFKRDGTGVDWYYGENTAGQGGSESDFESVALHELGHNVQHGHINDGSDPMYFQLTTGTSARTLSSADINGSLGIVGYSSGFGACGDTGMLAFDCSAAPTVDFVGSPIGTCGSSLSVDFTDVSTNGPTAWSWNFGDTGTSSLRNPSHNYTSTGLYTVELDASNTNGSDNNTKENYIVLTSNPTAASCSPTFTGHNNCCRIGVINVTFGNIDKTTDTNTEGDPLEEDFTCTDFTVLEASQTYSIAIQTGPSNNENVRVYIDWNNDGTLAASELEFSSDNVLEFHNGNITVPTSAVRGTALRMRVLSDFAGITSPCENIDFGQVENYSVLVAEDAPAGIPGAVPDTSLRVNKNANPALLDLAWAASCGTAASNYSIHEGSMDSFYSHTKKECSTGGVTSFTGLNPAAGDRYYIVVPLSSTAEGSYGLRSPGIERPVSTSTCITTQDTTACP